MKYPNVTSLVPEGEHFDESAVGEGVWVSASHLNAIESELGTGAQAVEQANSLVETANQKADDLQEQLNAASTQLEEKDNTITARDARIAELEAEIETYKGKPSGTGTTLSTKEDTSTEEKQVPSYLDDNNPINQFADKHIGKKN